MSDLDSDSRYADGETLEYIKQLEAERDDYKARALQYERTNAEQAAMLNQVIAERDGLMKDAERSNTLLLATKHLLTTCSESHYVLSAISEVDIPYDGTICDGGCLLEDITLHLDDMADAIAKSKP